MVSPLDSYVSGRMITLAAPCRALMEPDPLTVTLDFLLDDMSEQIKEISTTARRSRSTPTTARWG